MHVATVAFLLFAAAPAFPNDAAPTDDIFIGVTATDFVPTPGTTLPQGKVILRVLGPQKVLREDGTALAVDGVPVVATARSTCDAACDETITVDALPAGTEATLSLATSSFDTVSWPIGDRADTTAPTFAPGRPTGLSSSFNETLRNPASRATEAGFDIAFQIPAATDDFSVTTYRVVSDASTDTVAFVRGDAAVDGRVDVAFGLRDPSTHSECFSVTAIDVAGNETALEGTACFDLVSELPPSSCACTTASSASPVAMLGVLGALGVVFSRRRRP